MRAAAARWIVAASLLPAACFVTVPTARRDVEGSGGAGGAGDGAGAGASGGGGDACPSPFADCDGDGTCEIDTETDVDHCGRCDRGCLTASCANGNCQPLTMKPGQAFPHLIALDEQFVYWTNGGADIGNGSVMRVRKDGTAQRTLASGGKKPRGIALDGDYVYWSDGVDGSLHRAQKHVEESDEPLWTNGTDTEPGDGDVLIHDSKVYWTHERGGLVRRANLDGSNAMAVASGQPSPKELAALGGFLYFTVSDAKTLRRVPLAGGTVEAISAPADDDFPPVAYGSGIVESAGVLFYRESSWGIGRAGRVVRFDPVADTFMLLANAAGAAGVAVDAEHAYFTSPEDSTIGRAPRDPGETEVLVTLQTMAFGIAVDDEAVYWTTRVNPGAVMKVAK
jgi:sugar lactone lactonase YvrE